MRLTPILHSTCTTTPLPPAHRFGNTHIPCQESTDADKKLFASAAVHCLHVPTMHLKWPAVGTAGNTKLRLAFGSHMIPHPKKADKGGEDACFVSNSRRMFGEHPVQPPFCSPSCFPPLAALMLPQKLPMPTSAAMVFKKGGKASDVILVICFSLSIKYIICKSMESLQVTFGWLRCLNS